MGRQWPHLPPVKREATVKAPSEMLAMGDSDASFLFRLNPQNAPAYADLLHIIFPHRALAGPPRRRQMAQRRRQYGLLRWAYGISPAKCVDRSHHRTAKAVEQR